MSATEPILEEIKQHILENTDRYEVDLFPDDPETYRLNAEDGAILVQYIRSDFEKSASTDLIHQRRSIKIALTVVSRSQHGDHGALFVLDQVRLAIEGFKPVNCEACSLIQESFDGVEAGLWYYQLIIQTETYQVQRKKTEDLPKLVEVLTRRKGTLLP